MLSGPPTTAVWAASSRRCRERTLWGGAAHAHAHSEWRTRTVARARSDGTLRLCALSRGTCAGSMLWAPRAPLAAGPPNKLSVDAVLRSAPWLSTCPLPFLTCPPRRRRPPKTTYPHDDVHPPRLRLPPRRHPLTTTSLHDDVPPHDDDRPRKNDTFPPYSPTHAHWTATTLRTRSVLSGPRAPGKCLGDLE